MFVIQKTPPTTKKQNGHNGKGTFLIGLWRAEVRHPPERQYITAHHRTDPETHFVTKQLVCVCVRVLPLGFWEGLHNLPRLLREHKLKILSSSRLSKSNFLDPVWFNTEDQVQLGQAGLGLVLTLETRFSLAKPDWVWF